MRIISYIILLIIILAGITFAILNAELVTLNYYFGAGKISLSLLMVLCLGIGVLLGLLTALWPILRLKRKNYRLKSQLKQLEKDRASSLVSNNQLIENN